MSNPEFLREGCAVADLMNPDRIVIGAHSEHAIDLMKKVYEPFMAPILVTDINSAELIKHAANSFLALKISYINAVSAICEASGADVEKVADGIGMDRRIGRNFLNAGIGYGGSCFPKDIAAFIAISEQLGVPFKLLKEVQRINADAKGSLPQGDPRDALGLAGQENRRLGPDLQARHRRHPLLRRDRTRGGHAEGGSARHRLRSEGDGKGARVEAIAGATFCELRAGSGRRRGGADHRHGVGGVCQRRSRHREREDDTPIVFDGRNLVRSRDDGEARLPIPFDRPRAA